MGTVARRGSDHAISLRLSGTKGVDNQAATGLNLGREKTFAQKGLPIRSAYTRDHHNPRLS
jgi:hypothetical protein